MRLSSSLSVALPGFEVLFEELQAILRQEKVGVREQVADVEVPGKDRLGAGEVLERAADDHVWRRQHDERRIVETNRLHQVDRLLGLRFVEDETLDDSYLPVERFLAQGGAQREPTHLLRHALLVAARVRSEDRSTALHGRFADRAVARATGALLSIRLGAAAGNRAAGLGRGRPLARVGELAQVGLVHDRHVGLLVEHGLGELDLAVALAEGVEERNLERVGFSLRRLLFRHGLPGGLRRRHQTFLPVGLPDGPLTFTGLVDCLTSTSAPFAPGTPPLSSSRFRSASTRTTL